MKDDKVFLQNILECIVKIETYTNELPQLKAKIIELLD